MTKRILALLLLAAMMLTCFVACKDNGDETGTTVAETDTDAEPTEAPTDKETEPTAAPTEEPTAEPTEPATATPTEPATEEPTEPAETEPAYYDRTDAAVGFKNWSFDTFYVNGSMYFESDGQSDQKLEAIDKTVIFEIGAAHDSFTFRGWIGFEQPMASFGYVIDDGKNVFGDFFADTEAGVKGAGGENASRFEILVPIAKLEAGSHNVAIIVKLDDGKIVKMYDITVVIKNYEVDASIKFHCCVDYVMNAGPDGAPYYQNLGASTINSDGTFPEATGFNPLGEDFILSIKGWNAVDGGIAGFVWSVDGKQWFDCVNIGTHDGMPLEDYFTQIGIPGAPATNAMYEIGADLTAFNGQTVDVYFAAVSAAQEGKLTAMVKVVGVKVPKIVTDIDFSFKSDIANQAAGTDLNSSDLASFFTFMYGLSDPHSVLENENGKVYAFGGINEMFADIDGKNGFTVDMLSADATAQMFCRGVHACHPADTAGIQFVLNNYYETDGNNYMGGAGIWGRISNGTLTIFIKYYNTEKAERIGNAEFTFPVSGTKLTFADDGKDVLILVDGKLITKVTLTGSVDYDDLVISPSDFSFAAKAEIITANGTVATVENTLVTTIPSQIGIAVRPGVINFASVEVIPFADVTIIEDLPEVDWENLKLTEAYALAADQLGIAGYTRGAAFSPDGKFFFDGVLNSNPNNVSMIDLETGKRCYMLTFEGDAFAKGLAVDDRGYLYVGLANKASANDVFVEIFKINYEEKSLEKVARLEVYAEAGVGMRVNGMAVNQVGDKYYAYLFSDKINKLFTIDVTDPANPAVTGSVAMAESFYLDADTNGTCYVATNGDKLSVVNADGTITEIAVPNAYAVALYGKYALVAPKTQAGNVVLYVVDIASGEIVANVTADTDFTAGGTQFVYVRVCGDTLYVVVQNDRILSAKLAK